MIKLGLPFLQDTCTQSRYEHDGNKIRDKDTYSHGEGKGIKKLTNDTTHHTHRNKDRQKHG